MALCAGLNRWKFIYYLYENYNSTARWKSGLKGIQFVERLINWLTDFNIYMPNEGSKPGELRSYEYAYIRVLFFDQIFFRSKFYLQSFILI